MSASYDHNTYWERRYAAGGNSGRGSYGEEGRQKVDLVLALCNEVAATTILDVGSGDGSVAFRLLENMPGLALYLGVDISRTAVDACNRRSDELGIGLRATFLHGDAFALADVSGRTMSPEGDVVLCLDVLHHVELRQNHDKLIEDAVRAAKKAAVFSAWNPHAVETREPQAGHCFYHPFDFDRFDGTFEVRRVATPDPIKTLVVLVRRAPL